MAGTGAPPLVAALQRALADQSARPYRVVRFENLCVSPETTLAGLYRHVDLDLPSIELRQAAAGLHFPDYYRPAFSASKQATITTITADTAQRLGYDPGSEATA